MDNNAFIVKQLLAFPKSPSLCYFKTADVDCIVKTMVAMANGHGGTILIGVDDHRHVVGVDAPNEVIKNIP